LSISLLAFSTLRRLKAHDFMKDFLQEVASKLDTFSPFSLGNVLWALATLKYTPSQDWLDKVAQHLHEKMWTWGGEALSMAVYGLARCGYKPSDEWMEVLLGASQTKFKMMGAQEFVYLGQAMVSFGWRPLDHPEREVARKWLQWHERFCYGFHTKALISRQVGGGHWVEGVPVEGVNV
jgi:hypothetical protein